MTVTRFSPVRTVLTAVGGGTFPGGGSLPGAGAFKPPAGPPRSGNAERDEFRGGGGDLDESRGGGGSCESRRPLPRDLFEPGCLGTPVPAIGAAAPASKHMAAGTQAASLSETDGTGTANASQKNPARQVVDLLKKLLEFLNKGAHRDENDTDDSRSGGGIADGSIGSTGQG